MGFLVVTFLLTMDFLFDYLDLLLDKGVSLPVVAELFFLGLGWMTALSVPMGVLAGTLMTFGRLAHDNEITAIQAAGISPIRIILPPLIGACIVAVLLTLFQNYVLPESNHAFANLLTDITRKRPTVHIKEGVFINDFEGYSILVKKMKPRSDEIYDVTIYQTEEGKPPTTIAAKSGKIYFSPDGNTLTLELHHGEIHEAPAPGHLDRYRRLTFKTHIINIPNPGASLVRTQRETRGDRELSASDMLKRVKTLQQQAIPLRLDLEQSLKSLGYENYQELVRAFYFSTTGQVKLRWHERILERIRNLGRSSPSLPKATVAKQEFTRIQRLYQQIETREKRINKYLVEIHKKFSIPAACIVFVLIGAPLGIIARRGGITVGFISIAFFVFYYACLIAGEQLADRKYVEPWIAMWAANVVLGTLGTILVLRTCGVRIRKRV
jgi:lipopolysaccharide export system permease protein